MNCADILFKKPSYSDFWDSQLMSSSASTFPVGCCNTVYFVNFCSFRISRWKFVNVRNFAWEFFMSLTSTKDKGDKVSKFDLRCSWIRWWWMSIHFRVQFIWFHTGNFCFAKKWHQDATLYSCTSFFEISTFDLLKSFKWNCHGDDWHFLITN